MAIEIRTPRFSFVQFEESDSIDSCNFPDINLCLPVYEDGDVAFQFILVTDTEEEADALCDLNNELIQMGAVKNCADGLLVNFNYKPQRFRIGEKRVLYNASEGLPHFASQIAIGDCFRIKIIIDEYSFCSNCFVRIGDPCHTSVVEYGNDENGFGFNYCNSEGEEIDGETCDPTIIQFTNQSTLSIPYTAALQAKYGAFPSVQVWIYDENGDLVNAGLVIKFDAYPPTTINIDLGGNASGIVKVT